MADKGLILVTGAAGQHGAVGVITERDAAEFHASVGASQRARIDGVTRELTTIATSMQPAVIARLKVLADLSTFAGAVVMSMAVIAVPVKVKRFGTFPVRAFAVA